MRRSACTLEDVAAWDNLALAFARAARGKRERIAVRAFEMDLGKQLTRLRCDILGRQYPFGQLNRFRIWDPKERWIQAPAFRDRVLHHALIRITGSVLERPLVADTFACRKGLGNLAAARRAQQHCARFPWYAQTDVKTCYSSLQHAPILEQLARLFRDRGLLRLFENLLGAYASIPGQGLPIGALTSQCLANLALAPMDRFLLQEQRVSGMVRYMDDIVLWANSRREASHVLGGLRDFAWRNLRLQLHRNRIGRSIGGVTFVGYRVRPTGLGLSARRRLRYRQARRRWEQAHLAGSISASQLQSGYAAALASIGHAHTIRFRQLDLQARPALDA